MVDDELMRSVSIHFSMQFNKIIHINFIQCVSHDYVSHQQRNPDQVLAQLLHKDNKLYIYYFFFRLLLLCWSLNSIVLCIATTSKTQVCAWEDIVIERERDRLSPKEYIVFDAAAVIYSLQKQQENDIRIKYIMSVAANRIDFVTAVFTDHWR